MFDKEILIEKLSLNDKINLIVFKDSNNTNGVYNLSRDKVNEFIPTICSSLVFKKKEVVFNYDSIKNLLNILLENVHTFKQLDNSNLQFVKVSNNEEVTASVKTDYLSIFTKKEKAVKKHLSSQVELSNNLKEKLDSSEITKFEYDEAVSKLVTIDDIDNRVREIIDFIIPLIKAVDNHNVGNDSNVRKNMISKKTKQILLLICIVYYNAMMYFVYGNRVSDGVLEIIIVIWAALNVVFIVAWGRVSMIRFKKKKKDDLTTDDFKVVSPTEKTKKKETVKEEVIGEEVIQVESNNTVFTHVDLQEACSDFYNYTLQHGLMIEHKKIKELFAAMASSRLIVLANNENNNKFIELINSFFGNKTFSTTLEDGITSESLIYFEGSGITDFFKGINDANNNLSNVCITSLFNVDLSTCHLYLKNILRFCSKPNDKSLIKINGAGYNIEEYLAEKKLYIPKNMWFFLFAKSNDVLINETINSTALYLDLGLFAVEKVENNFELRYMSVSNFMDEVNHAREHNHLSNESWVQLDEVEKLLNEKYEFTLENVIVRKLESYASVLNVMFEDEKIAVDSMISNVLLPVIYSYDDNMYHTVLNILKEVFGDENIVLTKDNLNKYK